MRTKKKTRVSFSVDTHSIDVQLPAEWADLSQSELYNVLKIMSDMAGAPGANILFVLFKYFTKVTVLERVNDSFRCRFIVKEGKKRRKIICRIAPAQLAELLEPLEFIFEPGAVPVRIESWHRANAVDENLHGVSFSDYLKIENLYQGFITAGSDDALDAIAHILYPGINAKYIDKVFRFGLLQWLIQIKTMFARLWPNFFRPVSGASSAPAMLEIMNNEIRALTGGDVTKEAIIFTTDCWRALTELDFKAKEAEEFKRQLSKHNS